MDLYRGKKHDFLVLSFLAGLTKVITLYPEEDTSVLTLLSIHETIHSNHKCPRGGARGNISKVLRIHSLGTTDVSPQFSGNPSNS